MAKAPEFGERVEFSLKSGAGTVVLEWLEDGSERHPVILAVPIGLHSKESSKSSLPISGGAIGSKRFRSPAIIGPALSPNEAHSMVDRYEHGLIGQNHIVERSLAATSQLL